jgi:hypothetical protein
MSELKDVKCEKCGRPIGRRAGNLFVYSDLRIKFNKTARIFCTFPDCNFEQDFPVNRKNNDKTNDPAKFSLTNAFV